MPHIMHPFDNLSLTFGQIKELIIKSLSGTLEGVFEKFDGLNLQVTVKNNEVVFARNKFQLGNPVGCVDDLYTGNVFEVREVFKLAMFDLKKCLMGILLPRLNDFFQNGKKFLSFEIIHPKTINVIEYRNSPFLVFHSFIEYNNGEPVSYSIQRAAELAEIVMTLKSLSKYIGVFDVMGPQPINLSDLSKKIDVNVWLNKLDQIRENYIIRHDDLLTIKTSLEDTLGDRHYKIFSCLLDDMFSDFSISKSNTQEFFHKICYRWAYKNKSVLTLNEIKNFQLDKKFLDLIIDYDKQKSGKQWKRNQFSLEMLFFDLGAHILENCDGLSINDTEYLIKKIKNVERMSNSEFVEQYDKYLYLSNLNHRILSNEGIVFLFDGNIYKYTGMFAPINRFLGCSKFNRGIK